MLENRFCIRERMHNKARDNLLIKFVELKFEGGDDAEIPATPSERPEQVRVLGGVCAKQFAICRDDISGQEIVDG